MDRTRKGDCARCKRFPCDHCSMVFPCSIKRHNHMILEHDEEVESHAVDDNSVNSEGTLSPPPTRRSCSQTQEADGINPPIQNVASESQKEIHGEEFIIKRIEQEETLILEKELELQNAEGIKREVEEKIESLNQEILTRKKKVDNWKELFDD